MGKTEAGATLTINEDTVTVGTDGSFSYEVVLEVGDNAYYLTAVDAVGHTADQTIIIKREKYEPGETEGESNAMLYAGVAAAVVIVVVLLLVYFMVIQKHGGGEEGPDEGM